RGVGDHKFRLMEEADEVLALCHIDGRLSSDRRIDLCEQRCRYLNVVDSSLDDSCREAGDVADDTAAQGDYHATAIHARGDESAQQAFESREALCRLPCGQSDRPRLDLFVA